MAGLRAARYRRSDIAIWWFMSSSGPTIVFPEGLEAIDLASSARVLAEPGIDSAAAGGSIGAAPSRQSTWRRRAGSRAFDASVAVRTAVRGGRPSASPSQASMSSSIPAGVLASCREARAGSWRGFRPRNGGGLEFSDPAPRREWLAVSQPLPGLQRPPAFVDA